MTREAAREFVRLHAATDANPALTETELDAVLDQSRTVDATGLRVTDAGYTDTYWATRAVVIAIDVKLSKAMSKVDLVADGTQVAASQLTPHLKAQRSSWRARLIPGSA